MISICKFRQMRRCSTSSAGSRQAACNIGDAEAEQRRLQKGMFLLGLHMIDIHSHILPGLDDGSKSWDMT